MNSPSITRLVGQLRSGEHFRACWGELHERFWPFLVQRGMDCGLKSADAKDVASQVMMRLPYQLQAEKYDEQKGDFEAWLTTVIKNAVKDYLKSRANRERQHSLDDSHYDGIVSKLAALESVATLASELCHLYDSCLLACALDVRGRVTEWEWKAFFRTAVRKIAAKEVAEQLGTTQAKVYQATYKVRRLLEQAITPQLNSSLGLASPASNHANGTIHE